MRSLGFVFLIMLTFTITGCFKMNVPIGIYRSTCVLYDTQPDLIITINDDSTFTYKRPFVEEDVIGTWVIFENWLILSSSEFMKEKEGVPPKYKYTDASGKDIYLIRKRKLLRAMDDNNFTEKCVLVKSRFSGE